MDAAAAELGQQLGHINVEEQLYDQQSTISLMDKESKRKPSLAPAPSNNSLKPK